MKKEISKFVGSRIRSYRLNNNLTQKELGNKLGVKHNTVSSYEKGTNEPEQDTLFRLAKILNVSINDFFPYDEEKNINITSDYPFLPEPISAGLPNTVDGVTERNVEKITIPDYLMGKWAGNSDIYITRTNGESMNKIIPHDSLIAVKPIELHELKDNDIVVYRNHGEYAVKRFEKHDDKLVFRPDSTDTSFTDDVVYKDNADDLRIKGKVVLWIVTAD